MRITHLMSDRNFLAAADRLNEQLDEVTQQVSSGKRMLGLREAPSDSAALVEMRAQLSELDQYQSNTDSGNFLLGLADNALASAHGILTTVYVKGSGIASSSNDSTARSAAAQEIRALRDQLLALGNSEAQGRFIFAGSRVESKAFRLDDDTVTYQGDATINAVSIGDSLEVRQGVPGDAAFGAAFAAIQGVLVALDGNDTPAIQQALGAFEEALGALNEARGSIGTDLGVLQNAKLEQDGRETALRGRKSILEDADLAEAITSLGRIQTQIRAALSVQTVVQRTSLFDLMG